MGAGRMFRKLSLRALYDNHDEMTLRQRLIYTVVMNVCPALVFLAAVWAFSHWVWPDRPMIVNWK
jgi:hypothetical protein